MPTKRLVVALAAVVNIRPSTRKLEQYLGADLTLEQAAKIQQQIRLIHMGAVPTTIYPEIMTLLNIAENNMSY